MSKLLNLDKLVKEDKILILNGDEYYIAGDLPVKMALKMQKAGKGLSENPESGEHLEDAYKVLYDVFCIRNKDFMEFDKFMESINTTQYVALCNFIAGIEPVEQEPDTSGNKNEPEESSLKT